MSSFLVYVWDDRHGRRSVMVVSVELQAVVDVFSKWCEEQGWTVETKTLGRK